MDLTVTILSEQASRVNMAIKGVYPKGVSVLSDIEWTELQITEFLKRTVGRHERKAAMDNLVVDNVDTIIEQVVEEDEEDEEDGEGIPA